MDRIHMIARKPAVLAIDLGTSSVKTLVVSKDGTVLGRGSHSYPVSRPAPGAAEQDPETWWFATQAAVRDAVHNANGASIEGIGLSGQMHGTVLLDRDGKLLRPAIIWEDARGGGSAREIEQGLDGQDFVSIAGSRSASGFQASTLRWIQRSEPETWERVATVLLPKDYIRYRLSGTFASEPSDASSTVLMDVESRSWSPQILSILGVSQEQVPPLGASHRASASLRNDIAAELGLPAALQIAGGAGDAPAAALASGGFEPATLLLTISTGSQAIQATPRPSIDPAGRIHSWCHCLPPESGAGWYMMGATMTSGMALSWLRDNVLGLPGDGAFASLETWAAEAPAGSNGLLFVPYLSGERTPHMDPLARGMFLGLTAAHDRRHLVRAVMEGTIYALLQASEVLRSLSREPDRIVLTGGGVRSKTWTQIVADMFGLPVLPNREADGSALGAALLAGSSLDWFTPQDGAAQWLRLADPVEPRPESRAVYEKAFGVFASAYDKHRSDFPILASLDRGA
jgi:xylulokinase